ncbi:Hypothetical predicted protein, partial [Paramuricea clavata]
IAKFFFLSSHEQILGNSTNLSDFVVVEGLVGNFDMTGNSDEVDDSDGTGNFDRMGEVDDLNGVVENLSGERNGVMSYGSLDAWEFHSQHPVESDR